MINVWECITKINCCKTSKLPLFENIVRYLCIASSMAMMELQRELSSDHQAGNIIFFKYQNLDLQQHWYSISAASVEHWSSIVATSDNSKNIFIKYHSEISKQGHFFQNKPITSQDSEYSRFLNNNQQKKTILYNF